MKKSFIGILALAITTTSTVSIAQTSSSANYYEQFKAEFEQAQYAPEYADFIDENIPSRRVQCSEVFQSSPSKLHKSAFTIYDLGPSCESYHDYRIELGGEDQVTRPVASWHITHKLMWTLTENNDSFIIQNDEANYRSFHYGRRADNPPVNRMKNIIRKSSDGKLYFQETWKTPCGRILSVSYGKCGKTIKL